jgi:hypothetical protein
MNVLVSSSRWPRKVGKVHEFRPTLRTFEEGEETIWRFSKYHLPYRTSASNSKPVLRVRVRPTGTLQLERFSRTIHVVESVDSFGDVN